MKRNYLVALLLGFIIVTTSIAFAQTRSQKTTWHNSDCIYIPFSKEYAYDFSVTLSGPNLIYTGFSTSYTATFTLDSVNPVLRTHNLGWINITKITIIIYGGIVYGTSSVKVHTPENLFGRLVEGESRTITIEIKPMKQGSLVLIVFFRFADSALGENWHIDCATTPDFGPGYIDVVFPWFLIVIPVMMVAVIIAGITIKKHRKPTLENF